MGTIVDERQSPNHEYENQVNVNESHMINHLGTNQIKPTPIVKQQPDSHNLSQAVSNKSLLEGGEY